MKYWQVCGTLILIAAGFYAMTWMSGSTPIESYEDCPPYWKCNGTPATNDANCKCWDSK